MSNTQCFSFNDGVCNCLNELVCKKKPCRFSKTSSELKDSNNKSFKRISKLSELQQKSISVQYFNGKKPWIKE